MMMGLREEEREAAREWVEVVVEEGKDVERI
jgi:hypothetical protein